MASVELPNVLFTVVWQLTHKDLTRFECKSVHFVALSVKENNAINGLGSPQLIIRIINKFVNYITRSDR